MILFDLDGTLWDSSDVVAESWNMLIRKETGEERGLTGADIARNMGKTMNQIAEEISAQVSKDVKDPYVRVDIVNFSVDVMGEVRAPQRVYAGHQNFTVLDALSQCGDLTEFGKRDRVFVIRTEEGKRNYHRLDLNSSDVFNSPYFYLKQHDVVYVEPNQIRIDNSKYNQNNAFKLSVISTVVSSVSVIASLIIALVR